MLIVGHFFDVQINITLKPGLLFVVIQWLKWNIFNASALQKFSAVQGWVSVGVSGLIIADKAILHLYN